ncbi:MAG TPA: hypothetical protein QGG18_02475 [Rhodospirillales bacterium]|nr:hypothetical protein [Rhodospirillales bacterium]
MKNGEKRVKHLEMIQAVITRMASSSALMKNYALGTFTMGAGLSRFLQAPEIMLASAGLVVSFWFLDSKYLQQEKWFRDIYNAERKKPDTEPVNFAITPTLEIIKKTNLCYGLKSWATRWLYVPMLVICCLLWLSFHSKFSS